MSTAFAVAVVLNGDPDDELITLFHDRFDGHLGRVADRTVARVYVDGTNPVEVARSVIGELENEGFEVLGVDLDLVNMSDMAQRLGSRTRQSIRQLVKGERGPGGFPTCLGTPGGVQIWDWGTASRWFRAHNLGGDPEQPLTYADVVVIDAWLADRKKKPAAGSRSAQSSPRRRR